jgi:glycosyltransferase involved in cell wall biosynthesis
MRVTHVITRLIVGGAQENTVATVCGLHERGVDVDLVSGPTTGSEGSLESVFKEHPNRFSVSPHLIRSVHPFHDWRALRDLEEYFRKQSPDIVHTHSGKAGILGRVAAHRAGVPVIVDTIHGPSFGTFQGPVANAVFRAAERYAFRYTTHLITVANAMTEQYLAAGIGTAEHYTRVFSGFDLTPFTVAKNDSDLRARLGIGPNDFVLGKIARLFELKGHDDLFKIAPDVVRRCPEVKFLLVGDGPWRQRFETQVRTMKLENHFVFTGLVPPNEVSRYVGIMDALVHLSRREGLPRALPQALAAGKPVVAFDCDGAREVCLENETGFLVNPGDLATLTEKIIHLVKDPGLRERLGKKGQRLVKQNFSVEQMVENIHALYVRLLNKAQRAK